MVISDTLPYFVKAQKILGIFKLSQKSEKERFIK